MGAPFWHLLATLFRHCCLFKNYSKIEAEGRSVCWHAFSRLHGSTWTFGEFFFPHPFVQFYSSLILDAVDILPVQSYDHNTSAQQQKHQTIIPDRRTVLTYVSAFTLLAQPTEGGIEKPAEVLPNTQNIFLTSELFSINIITSCLTTFFFRFCWTREDKNLLY